LRIFQEVPLPPTCYLAEVALWVALGRVPQILTKESLFGEDYSDGDPRTSRAALDEDEEILAFDSGFSQAELEHLGIEVDLNHYSATKNLLSLKVPHLRKPTGAEAVEAYEFFESALADLGSGSDPRRVVATTNVLKEAVDWVNSIDAQADAAVDIARAEVFRSLVKGELRAVGWRVAPGESTGADTPLVPVLPAHWTLRSFDWDESELRHSSGSYYAVQVSTSEMMSVFPRPQCEPRPKTLDVYPGCILMEDDGSGSQLPRVQRGRPAKGGGLIRDAVLNFFTDKASRGELPEKSEALAQEMMDFVSLVFKTTLGRSTAQRYIKMLPENGARYSVKNLPDNKAAQMR